MSVRITYVRDSLILQVEPPEALGLISCFGNYKDLKLKINIMLEKRVIVFKDWSDRYWYTLQTRKVYFLFRSKWVDVPPIYQPSYEAALNLCNGETSSEGGTSERIKP